MTKLGKYAIRDLERLSGIRAHTIRMWEKRYGIFSPKRTDTNIRYYANDDLRKLLNISLLNKQGYRISEISEMSPEEIMRKLAELGTVKPRHESFHEGLLLSMIEMNEAQFNKVFLGVVMGMGFEQAVIRVIFPFFERIGMMWHVGTINPAQEHFISNIIRQKIIAATDALYVTPAHDAKTVLLFLPESELHELGLLFYNYAFRLRGFKTIYLGQSVPRDSLDRVMHICTPDYIVTGMTNAMNPRDFKSFSAQLSKAFPGKKIFYTGPVPLSAEEKLPKNAFLVSDLIEMLKLGE